MHSPRRAWPRCLRWLAGLLALLVACHAAAQTSPLKVGSKRFTESYILAEVMAQSAAPQVGAPPEVRQGLGNTAIVYEALRSGGIDVYAEYTGTIGLEILKSPQPMSLDASAAFISSCVIAPLCCRISSAMVPMYSA